MQTARLIRYVDLATHTTRLEEPGRDQLSRADRLQVRRVDPGPRLLEALQILEGFDLKAMGHNRPEAIHTIAETIKLAFADRDTYYADPSFRRCPAGGPAHSRICRTSPRTDRPQPRLARAPARRPSLDTRRCSTRRPTRPGGTCPPPLADAHDTTTCLVADRFGNVVAATPSGWSGVVAGDTGVWLGSRLQSFNTWEDHPNVIVPGKRPRITLSPTLVLKGSRPVLAVSVAGGDNQDQMTLQLLLNHIDFGLEPAASVVAPRFMSDHFISSFRQTPPALGRLRINPEIGASILEALKTRGHILSVNTGSLAPPHA